MRTLKKRAHQHVTQTDSTRLSVVRSASAEQAAIDSPRTCEHGAIPQEGRCGPADSTTCWVKAVHVQRKAVQIGDLYVTGRRIELQAHSARQVSDARHELRAQLQQWECGRIADCLLIFAELVINAVQHAGGATRISVVHGTQTLRFEVHDQSHAIPQERTTNGSSGGFGLRIVSELSDRWGWDKTAHGKVVWSDVPCCLDE